jgi:hypothetical protein
VAPLAAALVFACFEPAYEGLSDYGDRIFQTFISTSLLGALPTALVIGVPVFLVLRTRIAPSAINCIVAGSIVAAFPWLILTVLPQTGVDYAFDNGHTTIVNGQKTVWGWIQVAQFVIEVGAFGLIGGFVFWVVAIAGGRKPNIACRTEA